MVPQGNVPSRNRMSFCSSGKSHPALSVQKPFGCQAFEPPRASSGVRSLVASESESEHKFLGGKFDSVFLKSKPQVIMNLSYGYCIGDSRFGAFDPRT